MHITMDPRDAYDYTLPSALIRTVPCEPRDHARLLVYDTRTDTIVHTRFSALADMVPSHAHLVLNDTTVVPSRIWARKPTGGKIEVFVLASDLSAEALDALPGTVRIPVLVDRHCAIGTELTFGPDAACEVVAQDASVFWVVLRGTRTVRSVLERYGATPIPHYLERTQSLSEQALRARYQTIFAAHGASVAAPTASLHFTPNVFASLDAIGVTRSAITLNVGRGTFAPLTAQHLATNTLHQEIISVSPDAATAIMRARTQHAPVIAVGTTVVRAIESVARSHAGAIIPCTTTTNLFIRPPYSFAIIDGMITNFHLPRTSLMMLVDALLVHKGARRRIGAIYRIAIEEGYAFYSFGDSMMII